MWGSRVVISPSLGQLILPSSIISTRCRQDEGSCSKPYLVAKTWLWHTHRILKIWITRIDCQQYPPPPPLLQSAEYERFLKLIGFQRILVAPYSSSSNGQAERFVQNFKHFMKASDSKNFSSTPVEDKKYRANLSKHPTCHHTIITCQTLPQKKSPHQIIVGEAWLC